MTTPQMDWLDDERRRSSVRWAVWDEQPDADADREIERLRAENERLQALIDAWAAIRLQGPWASPAEIAAERALLAAATKEDDR